jgi:hypothetical protein
LHFGLQDLEEGTSHGTPALKVRGKLFARLKEDGETLVLKTSYEEREELIANDPETYCITDHYLNYPFVLASLARIREDALRELIHVSYKLAKRGKKLIVKRRFNVRASPSDLYPKKDPDRGPILLCLPLQTRLMLNFHRKLPKYMFFKDFRFLKS